MADFSLQALHDEIESDTESMGYKEAGGDWKGDQVIADLINSLTSAGAATITRKVIARNEIIYGIEFSECIGRADQAAPAGQLSEQERWYLSMLLRNETIDANDEEVFDALLSMFPAEGQGPDFRGTSRDNIQSTLQKIGSRGEVLWGEGYTATASQVGAAANL